MRDEHRSGAGRWPEDLARLDRELRGIVVRERSSFAEELRARLREEQERLAAARPGLRSAFPRGRWLLAAAAVVALLTVSLGVPPVRASFARLLGFPAAGVPESPAAAPEEVARPAPEEPGNVEGVASLTTPRPRHGPGESPDAAQPLPATLPHLLDPDQAQRSVADEYPILLQRAGIGGTVDVLVWVRPDGSSEFPQVLTSSGVGQLDMAALRATRGLRFAPATRGGRPVGSWVEFSIIFRPESN
jgi:TonB family protein